MAKSESYPLLTAVRFRFEAINLYLGYFTGFRRFSLLPLNLDWLIILFAYIL